MATITITVTVSNPGSGNKYYLDGVLQATYAATPGNTYKFDQADGSNSGHPLRLSITSDGTHNSGSAYTTGVTTSGTPGSAGAYTQIEVTATTVQALYYYCTNHSGMGGSFNTGSSATVQFQDRKGFDIQNFSADQTSVGQIYYNTSSGQFKAIKDGGPPIGSWSSGGNLPGNTQLQGAFGGRDSITTGGAQPPSGRVGDSFQYNGVAWSEIAELNTARDSASGLGTQGSGLVAGGYSASPTAVVGVVENWNGSSWTEVADVSPVRTGAGTAGVYTAGLVFGGNQPPVTASTMTWNGSAWTEVNDLNAARTRSMGQAIGTQTAALSVAGEGVDGTESWNGTSWTEIADLNTPRHLGGGSGIQTSAIVSSGRTGAPGYNPSVLCESWDGSSWTEVADVSSGRAYGSSAGTAAGNTNSESVIFGGATTSSTANTAATEEWNAAPFEVKTLTTS